MGADTDARVECGATVTAGAGADGITARSAVAATGTTAGAGGTEVGTTGAGTTGVTLSMSVTWGKVAELVTR
jgi:hypothetical protein